MSTCGKCYSTDPKFGKIVARATPKRSFSSESVTSPSEEYKEIFIAEVKAGKILKLTFIVVGKLKEHFLLEGVAEYLKRLKKFASVEVREISEQRTVEEEGQKLLSLVPPNSWLCLLDVAGKELDSETFAKKIAALALDGVSSLTFAIGGAFGVSEELRQAADFRLSLSQMTFTHQMARLVLAEQIYRAFKINRNEPYHW